MADPLKLPVIAPTIAVPLAPTEVPVNVSAAPAMFELELVIAAVEVKAILLPLPLAEMDPTANAPVFET